MTCGFCVWQRKVKFGTNGTCVIGQQACLRHGAATSESDDDVE